MQTPTHGPDAEQISAQVARVLASRVFTRSTRLRRFLRFLVEQALIGNLGQLKEHIIGVAVYDRKFDYDSRMDPIVRVEACRLRGKLKAYYTSIGRTDQIVIDLPKGAYVPSFRLRSIVAKKPAQEVSVRWPAKQSIVVMPFANLTHDTKDDHFSLGLTEELTHRLTRIPGLRVVAWASSPFQLGATPANLAGILQPLRLDTILRGSVRRSPDRVRVTVQLIASESGDYLWSETYDDKLENMFATQEHIARVIVQALEVKLTTLREPEPHPS